MSKQVSVIVVSYNVRGFLGNLINSLNRALEEIDSEIIVVDNSSDDDSVEYLRKNFPDVKLIENPHNVGFGRANNQGVKASTGEYLLLINPDAVVGENTIKEMMDFSLSHPDAGASSCKVLNADGTLQKTCRRGFPTPWVAFTKISGMSTIFPKSKLFGRYNLTYLDPDEEHEVDAIGGSFMFIPRRVFEAVGGFDEDYFMYGEDIDLCYKIKNEGYKVYYTPRTTAIHFKGESTRRSSINQTYEFYRAMSVFVEKRYGVNTFLSRTLRVAILINRQVRQLVLWMEKAWPAIADFCIIVAAMFLGEFLKSHRIYAIPAYGRPYFYIAPGIFFVLFGMWVGIYSENKNSIRLTILTGFFTFLFFSSLTYFFKEFAFSRLMVLVASAFMLIVLPAYRVLYQLKTSARTKRHPFFGRRTLVVGMDQRTVELIKKIRGKVSMGYDIVGIVSEERPVDSRLLGIKVVGSLDELPRLVREKKIEDVVFASGRVSYGQVLQAVGSVKDPSVSFKLVPDTMDVIIGKTYVDGLADVPLVDIDYNINKTKNKISKRLFDIVFGLLGIIMLSPIALFKRESPARRVFKKLPEVISGKLSFVGCSEYYPYGSKEVFGKTGITGVVQLNRGQSLSSEEIEKLYVYYAKNQSFWLDLEIIAKSFLQMFN